MKRSEMVKKLREVARQYDYPCDDMIDGMLLEMEDLGMTPPVSNKPFKKKGFRDSYQTRWDEE